MTANGSPLSRARTRLRGASAPIGSAPTLAAVIGLAGCGEPLHRSKWKDPPGGIPEGEGLLTGDDGEREICPDN